MAMKDCYCDGCEADRYIDRVLARIEAWWPLPESDDDPVGGPHPGCAEFDPGPSAAEIAELEGHPAYFLSQFAASILMDAHGEVAVFGGCEDGNEGHIYGRDGRCMDCGVEEERDG